MKHSLLRVLVAPLLLACAVLPPSASAEDVSAKARELIESGEHAAAKDLLASHLSESPDDAAAWQAMGLACFGLRWFEDASDAFAKADELAPEDGLTLFYRGVLILVESTKRDKEAREYLDRSAAIDSPVNDWAQLMKYMLLRFITIPGRSVTAEFKEWQAGLDPDSWPAQLAAYARGPVSNEKLMEQAATHFDTLDEGIVLIQAHLFIGMKCERHLYGLAASNLEKALGIDRPGTVAWELARAWFVRLGVSYNWDPLLGFKYAPNERGALEVSIRDADSFALARGLRNGDEILALDGIEADLNLLDATLPQLRPGDTYTLTVQREGQQLDLLLVMDTIDYRMRPAKPR